MLKERGKDTSPARTVFRCIVMVLAIMPAEFGATKVSIGILYVVPTQWWPEWHCTEFSEASPDPR